MRRNNKINREDIYYIKKLVKINKGIEMAIKKMESLEREIISHLKNYPESIYKRSLMDLIHFILVRKK